MNVEKESSKTRPTDVIQAATGSFGRWQLVICLSLAMTRCPAAWHHLSIVFQAPPITFQCANSSDDGFESTMAKQSTGNPCWSHEAIGSRWDAQNGAQKELNATVPVKCRRWKYDRSIFTETIVTEWNLVCDREQLATLAQSTLMLGNVFGDVFFGMLADRFGRKRPLVAAIVILVLSGTASAFVPWFELLLVLKFTTALAVGGTMVTSFVLCMESVGGRWRMVVATLYHLPYGVGYSLMALIAYLVRDWRRFQLAISLPPLCLMAYCWIIPESARWLVAAGRIDKAVEIIKTAAKTNRLPEPSNSFMQQLKDLNGAQGSQRAYNTCDLMRIRVLRTRTLCLCYHWFVGGVCFFGLSQYIGRIGGDIFVNVAVAGVMQVPGKFACLLTLDRFGRRLTLAYSFLLVVAGSLLLAAVPEGWPQSLKATFALCGIVGLSISLPTMYLYTTELYPTVVRNNGLGFTAMFARIGSVAAPVAVSLCSVRAYLPPLVFGVLSLVAVAFCWPLPETAHQPLPHSIDDVENCNKKPGNGGSEFPNMGFVSEYDTRL